MRDAPMDTFDFASVQPVDEMEGWAVSETARNPRNEGPELIKPMGPMPMA